MKRKEYKQGQDAREAIKKVAAVIGKTLGATLGPAGRNYQIPEGITNDGRSILAHLRFPDECEDNVALAFHEVANRTDKDAGDGTTTATVIAASLVETLIDRVPDIDVPIAGQQSVMEIARQLESEKEKAIALLTEKVVPVTTLEQLEEVALTSMEDEATAKIVAATIFKSGPNSFTALDEGFTGKIETSVQAGVEMPLSVAAPFMYNNGNEVLHEGFIPVLVANHIFEDYKEITPFMQSMLKVQQDKKLPISTIVIVGKQFSIPFVQAVHRVYKGSQGKINILLLSNAHLDDALFEDTAAFCDANYVDTHPRTGKNISSVMFTDCGLVEKVIATSKGAVFYGGKGTTLNEKATTTRVNARVMELQAQLAKEKGTKERTALERRISEFQGGKATIYVDAKTAAEKYYTKLKVEDCMNSCKGALEGGMVRGGGLTLKVIAEELGADSLLAKALCAPYDRIQANAGGELEISEHVMDSYLCAKAGIENAVSVVKTVLTIEGIVADVEPSMVESLKDAVLTE